MHGIKQNQVRNQAERLLDLSLEFLASSNAIDAIYDQARRPNQAMTIPVNGLDRAQTSAKTKHSLGVLGMLGTKLA
jgi:hypothetical protein